jgi:hypothetical protein
MLAYVFFLCVYAELENFYIVGIIVLPLALYSLSLYELCTLSGQMTERALEAIEQLQKYYPFGASRDLQLRV